MRAFGHDDLPDDLNRLAATVVDACGEVRRHLGAGLLESVYQEALAFELELRGVPFERDPPLPIHYKGRRLAKPFHPDFVVAGCLVLEAKATEVEHPVHFAQVMTYLRLSKHRLGLLVNFHAVPLGSGMRRILNSSIA